MKKLLLAIEDTYVREFNWQQETKNRFQIGPTILFAVGINVFINIDNCKHVTRANINIIYSEMLCCRIRFMIGYILD